MFKRYLTEREERQLLSTVRRHCGDILARRDYHWMRLLRNTGLRIGTFSKITLAMAEEALYTKQLLIPATMMKGGTTHTAKRLTADIKADIKALVVIHKQMRLDDDPQLPLVLSTRQQGLSIRSYQARMAYWCVLAGLNCKASPHWFRHTLAKRLMKTTTSTNRLGVVQAALDHQKIDSTAIYVAPDKEEIDQAVSEVQI